jgi:hydrogenase-4 component B
VMSAAMLKMGVYGMVLLTGRLLPAGPRWWAVAVLALGTVSAAYGILQASVATDLKRLLAYSTTENVGLMVTAVGVGLLLRSAGQPAVADVAVTAALLLVVSHAAFKTVLFLAAGSVLAATGERDLDRLGGLGAVMPVTGGTFAVAALGAAALPVSSGFVAEWVLLQALIHGPGRQDLLAAVLLPLTVAVVALTVGLALLTFVKAYAIGFLARPRSPGAAGAREAGPAMRAAMLLGAAAVVGLGLVPGPLIRVLATAAGADGVRGVGRWGVSLPAVRALLDPVSLLGLVAATALPVLAVTYASARRRPRRRVELAWGCGGVRVSPRMQYTATSYAEPLVRVFDDALRPTRDLEVTHLEESRYLERKVVFRQQVGDVVEHRLYTPIVVAARRVGTASRRIHNGSIHRYLAFSFTAVVLLLVVVSR